MSDGKGSAGKRRRLLEQWESLLSKNRAMRVAPPEAKRWLLAAFYGGAASWGATVEDAVAAGEADRVWKECAEEIAAFFAESRRKRR